MKFNVSPEGAIRCIKLFVGPVFCWPPPRSASKSDLIIRDVIMSLAGVWMVSAVIYLPINIYKSFDDAVKTTQNLCMLMGSVVTVIKMSVFRYHRDKFQIYHEEMEEFVELADAYERAILERHMDRCGPLHATFGFLAMSTAFSFCCAPIVLPQPLPLDTDYPFPFEDSPILLALLYIEQMWLIIQVFAGTIVDMQIALLLWFRGMRFELLAEEFRTVASLSDFNRCVEKHQELLTSTGEVISIIRYIAVAVTALTAAANICTGFQFIHHQPVAVLVEYFFFILVSSMEGLMYAWPADNLMIASESIAYATYNSNWIGESPEMLKNIQIVMLRAQRPLTTSVGGIIPKLDLDFYGKYLTTSFSYFTTLQAVVG